MERNDPRRKGGFLMAFTPEQQQIIDNAKSRIQAQTPSATDSALGVLARTGRMAVGGASGLIGIPSDAIKYGLNEIQGLVTGEEVKNVPFRDIALSAYDEATGGAGKPRNQFERVMQAGGEALTGGGVLAKTPMAMKTATDLISQVGAGAAAQWAAENSDNPLAPLVASIAGAVVPQMAAKAPATIVKQTAKGMGIDKGRIAQLEAAGMPVNVPAASNSPMIKRAANQMAELPGGSALRSSMDDAFNAAEKSIKSLGFKGQATPSTAGQAVNKALNRWQAESVAKFNQADDALKALVPDDAPANVSDDIASSIKAITSDKGLTARQIAERANHPAIKELDNLMRDASANGGQVSVGALKEARTKIGDMRFNPLIPNKQDAIAKRAYGALSETLKGAAKEVGGDDAARLMERRNRLYSLYMDENKNYVAKLQKKLGDTPEAIYQKLTSGDKIGASQTKRILGKLDADEMETVRDAWIYQKGGGDQFSISKWANEYRKLSDDAKSAFFKGDNAALKAHNTLIDAIENYQDVGRFANFSGTAPASINPLVKIASAGAGGGAGLGVLTGAISIPALITSGVISLGSAFAVNKALSGIMASPKYTKILANALTKADKNPQAFSKAAARAFADFGVNLSEFDKATESQTPKQFTPDQQEIMNRVQERINSTQPPAPTNDSVSITPLSNTFDEEQMPVDVPTYQQANASSPFDVLNMRGEMPETERGYNQSAFDVLKKQQKEFETKKAAGTNSPYFERLAMVESSNNYSAKAPTSSAYGRYQITGGTAKGLIDKYGKTLGVDSTNWTKPQNQEKLARKLTEENRMMLRDFLNRDPSQGELYIAHFAGYNGARKLLNKANSSKKAASVLPDAAKANQTIFYDGEQKNGKFIPKRARSVREVREILKSKMEG
jgi:hypothetical protein